MCKKVFCDLAKRSRSNQQVLCTTLSSQITVETMIEYQRQTVQWVMVSTKWPPFMVQCAKILKFSWPWKKIKKMSRSKQQVLYTTSSSQLKLLKPWLKVKVNQFNELWGPQKKCFGYTHTQMVGITRSLPHVPAYAGGQQSTNTCIYLLREIFKNIMG